ncbi:rhomboid family intramembrane serine protease [Chromobacterium sp. IIBBL 290-4]|uniref:rhomboid family intramembrane serine protease n=1 Tax=Chromobacterium sp. IIBBL 290-4 TaxID=2953890 RepID=UPI0020B8962B|nr:rhomboid family intramembrane serine protease [Chromobacterium sp. IIBBL 290-4]UTH72298.1 rhomboid family intramembrane serine protease [Chromobacterium sp. IIBBL 290-4]
MDRLAPPSLIAALRRCWPSALAALLPLAAPWGERAADWRYEPGRMDECWRWFGSSWAHADARHALLNSLALLFLAGLGGGRSARCLGGLAIALPVPIAVLHSMLPEPAPFLGASGVLYGWWAAVAWRERDSPAGRALAVLLALRLAWQGVWPQHGPNGEAVLWSAHLSGALLALLCCGLVSHGRCAARAGRPRTSVHS